MYTTVPKGFHETFVTMCCVFLVQMHFCEIFWPHQVFMVQILGSITFQRPVLSESNYLAKGLKVSCRQRSSRYVLIIFCCVCGTCMTKLTEPLAVQTTDE